MAHNTSRAQRMGALPVPELLRIYLSGSLASTAAGAELIRRGHDLPDRQPPKAPRRPPLIVIYGPVPNPPLREQLKARAADSPSPSPDVP